MARFTIIVLLICLGILGYLYYNQVTDHSAYDALKVKIQKLEKVNEELKSQKPRVPLQIPLPPRSLVEPPVVIVPRVDIKRAEPLK